MRTSLNNTLLSSFSMNAVTQSTDKWYAQLELGYRATPQGVDCHLQRHTGPLQVHRPLYPEGSQCAHHLILHPPGGVVGGDALDIHVEVESGAQALISAPSANRFYRIDDASLVQKQRIHLNIQEHAYLDWAPLETLFYEGSNALTQFNVNLMPNSHFIGWEISALGRKASGIDYGSGQLRQELNFTLGGRPLLVERTHLIGDGPHVDGFAMLQGHRVMGSLWLHPFSQPDLEVLRHHLEGYSLTNSLSSTTCLDSLGIVRVLSNDSREILEFFIHIWTWMRHHQRRYATPARVWFT